MIPKDHAVVLYGWLTALIFLIGYLGIFSFAVVIHFEYLEAVLYKNPSSLLFGLVCWFLLPLGLTTILKQRTQVKLNKLAQDRLDASYAQVLNRRFRGAIVSSAAAVCALVLWFNVSLFQQHIIDQGAMLEHVVIFLVLLIIPLSLSLFAWLSHLSDKLNNSLNGK